MVRSKKQKKSKKTSWQPPATWGWTLLALGFIFFLGCRIVSPWPLVYTPSGELRLLGLDGYYHVRHAVAVQQHFPHVSRYDVGTNYPIGERGVNQGFHDLILALGGFAGGGGVSATMAAGAWISILSSALSLLSIFWLAARLAAPWAGGLAVALVAFYPGHLRTYLSLGNADHHSTEVLLSLLMILGACACLQSEQNDWRRPAVLEALPAVLLVFTWFGAPLHLAALGLGWGLAVCLRAVAQQPENYLTASRRYLLGFFVTFIPLWLLSPEYRVNPQAWLYIAAWAVAMALLLPLADQAMRKLGTPALATAALALLAASLGAHKSGLLGQHEVVIAEHFVIDAVQLWKQLGPLALVFPVALAHELWAGYRGLRSSARLLALGYATTLVATWLVTLDFSYYVPGLVALVVALTASAVRWNAASLVLCTAVVLLLPMLETGVEKPWLVRGPAERELAFVDDGLSETLKWLKDKTPVPSVPPTARVRPFDDFHYPPDTYGVVCDWTIGHLVGALGGRTPIYSETFNPALSAHLLLQDENAFLEFLRARTEEGERFAYLLASAKDVSNDFLGRVAQAGQNSTAYFTHQADTSYKGGKVQFMTIGTPFEKILLNRLYLDWGDGAEHFRLVHASKLQRVMADGVELNFKTQQAHVRREALRLDPASIPELGQPVLVDSPYGLLYHPRAVDCARLWQIVKGATLVGELSQATELTLELRCRNSDRLIKYTRQVPPGEVRLVVPYPTETDLDDTEVVATGPYKLGQLEIEVSQQAVLEGQEVHF